MMPDKLRDSMTLSLELASEPLLQTGQARLGAFLSIYRVLAFEPYAPVGQADWGRSRSGGEDGVGAKLRGSDADRGPRWARPIGANGSRLEHASSNNRPRRACPVR